VKRVGAPFVIALACALGAASALAQPRPTPPRAHRPSPSGSSVNEPTQPGNELRAHFGADVAQRLVKSHDPNERLRGLARAGATNTPESMLLLIHAAEPTGVARSDARAMIEVARGLARFVRDAAADAALVSIVNTPAQSSPPRSSSLGRVVRDFTLDEAELAPRLQLAREIAAIALAETREARAIESLIAIARGGGPGQSAATLALTLHPPESGALSAVTLTTPNMMRLAAKVGDLRTIEHIRGLARSSDTALRAAALEALGEMGDMRAIEIATAAATEHEPHVRIAAVTALVMLDAPNRAKAVEALIVDDTTAMGGIRLAERTYSDGIAKALATRAAAPGDMAIKSGAIVALGRSPNIAALRALAELMRDASLHSDVVSAIARSPSPSAMSALESLAAAPSMGRMALRAYLVRALTRRETSAKLDALLERMATSSDGSDRAAAVATLLALGRRDLEGALRDKDARVRRAAAMATLAPGSRPVWRATLLSALAAETDDATRVALAAGLIDGDPEGRVTTRALVDRADSADGDAPLAALALARRGDDAEDAKVSALLAARDPILRAHVARGLAASSYKDVVGRLGNAFAYESDVGVRRAIIGALAARTGSDASAPQRMETLRIAARFDPDRVVRGAAARALAGLPATLSSRARDASEVAWLRIATADGQPPPRNVTASLYRSDGLAVPIAFDDDGYAIVAGVPPGETRLVLAPRLPVYQAPTP
jgi:HEAT repeat protein